MLVDCRMRAEIDTEKPHRRQPMNYRASALAAAFGVAATILNIRTQM